MLICQCWQIRSALFFFLIFMLPPIGHKHSSLFFLNFRCYLPLAINTHHFFFLIFFVTSLDHKPGFFLRRAFLPFLGQRPKRLAGHGRDHTGRQDLAQRLHGREGRVCLHALRHGWWVRILR